MIPARPQVPGYTDSPLKPVFVSSGELAIIEIHLCARLEHEVDSGEPERTEITRDTGSTASPPPRPTEQAGTPASYPAAVDVPGAQPSAYASKPPLTFAEIHARATTAGSREQDPAAQRGERGRHALRQVQENGRQRAHDEAASDQEAPPHRCAEIRDR